MGHYDHMSEQTETFGSTTPPKTRVLSRTRGAASGILLVLLGAWGALAPFIGPSFNFALTPDTSWKWTAARGWYEVLPGSVAFVGGLLLLFGRSRAVTLLGAWLGILAGGWFIVGPAMSNELTLGSVGHPISTNSGVRVAEILAFFYALGAVILFLAASAFGRLSVVTLRDVRVAERREAARLEAQEQAARDSAERDEADRDTAQWHRVGRDRSGNDDDNYDDNYDDNDHNTNQQGGYHTAVYGPASAGGSRSAGEPAPPYGRDTAGEQAGEGYDPNAGRHTPSDAGGDPGSQQGYHSALGYRDGEQQSPYSAPTYGRHDAGTRGGSPGEGEAGGTATQEQPR